MPLLAAHQILITAAMGLAAIFALRSVFVFSRGGGAAELVLGFVAITIGAALGLYLQRVRAKWLALKGSPGSRG